MTYTKYSLVVLGFCLMLMAAMPKQSWRLPDVAIERLDGEKVSAASLAQEGQPTLVSFWATWCKPCILELNEIQDVYEDWQDETGIKVVAISIDDARSVKRVPAMVNGKGWEFDIYLDTNSELKQALNVANVPHTFLLNAEGEIVYQHTSYVPGNEEILYEKILEIAD